ncbi:MAG: hypothetical protein QNK05_16820 [Myxococcota bacterium]|nr:hypothetical protein [Myxococcota bacterium]
MRESPTPARIARALLFASLAWACASGGGPDGSMADHVWTRPDAPDWRTSKFRGDRLQCRTEAGTVHVDRTRRIFEECMVDRGYTLVPEADVASCKVEATGTFYGWPEAFCQAASP